MKRSGILVFVNEKVYLETTVISYLAGRPSRDLVVAAHQEVTHQWWEGKRYVTATPLLRKCGASGGCMPSASTTTSTPWSTRSEKRSRSTPSGW
jgi:hypothetical protein